MLKQNDILIYIALLKFQIKCIYKVNLILFNINFIKSVWNHYATDEK